MTKRFVVGMLIAIVVPLVLPTPASAHLSAEALAKAEIQNKTTLVFEIKNVENFLNSLDDSDEQAVEEVAIDPQLMGPPKPKNYVPPKVKLENQVYMHEPEIRAYLCPKMGQKNCEVFIAILKAENGTHECTRDNRGLNRNGSLDVGLAQINWNPRLNPPYTVEQLRDCQFNLDIALLKYERRGFQPWYAYTKGAYKKFLPASAKI
ncbi:MAG: hypothetical protein A2660_00645 [Candidatus Doudnabacteria bacterium RIFCSPHIGHO2_01_FULL_45_18]|uniref:Transglycosylase SLT domain-containing protein n=1 Tax=Candidatus Doudnabacteria bacterium RIFCSPHIGHO2_01_FULL_45_18 TaxID=1817823 RepID=A0A1F5NS97_9BACT|nr:MAG: hypothetical protein A2660_00645 [Candidatus Doudnabacteria bacterium RIFCSPHIGHO2_01_FULL_45_18]